VLALF